MSQKETSMEENLCNPNCIKYHYINYPFNGNDSSEDSVTQGRQTTEKLILNLKELQ